MVDGGAIRAGISSLVASTFSFLSNNSFGSPFGSPGPAGAVNMFPITRVDLLKLATDINYFSTIVPQGPPQIALLSYQDHFANYVLGGGVAAKKMLDLPWGAFHEGGVYQKSTNSLYVSSNWAGSLSNPINMTEISMDTFQVTKSYRIPGLYEANGGTTWYPPGSDPSLPPPAMIWCDEGDFEHPSALISVDITTNKTTPIVTNFLGRNFSSVNDVRQHPVTGDLWFTDADYGYYQFFRPAPTIPKQVYRFSPRTGVIQVVADGFVQCNGLEFSPDFKTLYVSDTGAVGPGINLTRPATVYAYDVTSDMKRLENRRTFAYADSGFPDGMHTDTEGNLWAGCGDGVHVWNAEGTLLGKVYIGEMCNNFAFIPGGVLMFSNARLWMVSGINVNGREVCKDFGHCSGKPTWWNRRD